MAEQFANYAENELDGALTDVATSFDVTDGSVLPATGTFRLKCEDEIMLVTARSSNTLTVTRGQEGTTAVAHDSATAIKPILTAAGLTEFKANILALALVGANALGALSLDFWDVSSPSALAIGGAASTLALNLSRTGQTTTVKGAFQVDQAAAFTGASTYANATGYISFVGGIGLTGVATTGLIRFPGGDTTAIVAKNNAQTLDHTILTITAGDGLTFGHATITGSMVFTGASTQIHRGTIHYFQTAGGAADILTLSSGLISVPAAASMAFQQGLGTASTAGRINFISNPGTMVALRNAANDADRKVIHTVSATSIQFGTTLALDAEYWTTTWLAGYTVGLKATALSHISLFEGTLTSVNHTVVLYDGASALSETITVAAAGMTYNSVGTRTIKIGGVTKEVRSAAYVDLTPNVAAAAPASPAAGTFRMYIDTADGNLKIMGQGGSVVQIGNSA